MTIRELWFTGPRQVEIQRRAIMSAPAPGNGEVRVRGLLSAVSRGTELLLYRGVDAPTPFDPSLDASDAPLYPRRYGYTWVGAVEEPGANTPFKRGSRVFGLLAHGDVHVVPHGSLYELPASIPAARALLAPALETALTCMWDAHISLGERVIVLGGGVVGIACAYVAKRAGASVVVCEPEAHRRAAVRAVGISEAVAPSELGRLADVDVVIEATGDPSKVDLAVSLCGAEGTIALVSFYGERTAPVRLGAEFHRRRQRIVASQVSNLPSSRRARWSLARRFDLVLGLLEDSKLDALVDAPVSFEDAPDVFAMLAADPRKGLLTTFAY